MSGAGFGRMRCHTKAAASSSVPSARNDPPGNRRQLGQVVEEHLADRDEQQSESSRAQLGPAAAQPGHEEAHAGEPPTARSAASVPAGERSGRARRSRRPARSVGRRPRPPPTRGTAPPGRRRPRPAHAAADRAHDRSESSSMRGGQPACIGAREGKSESSERTGRPCSPTGHAGLHQIRQTRDQARPEASARRGAEPSMASVWTTAAARKAGPANFATSSPSRPMRASTTASTASASTSGGAVERDRGEVCHSGQSNDVEYQADVAAVDLREP